MAQCGGLDIFIANDQSGSVDAMENQKSREFIATLGRSLPLGNTPGGFRMAIADWDAQGDWLQYKFPIAGVNYTTQLSDIISYTSSSRLLSGGTDLALALQRSYLAIQQTGLPGGRPQVILLMTDALTEQTQPGLIDLATQIKNSGIYIAVMAIDEARTNTLLPDVASAGGYFTAANYDVLAADATFYIGSVAAAVCLGTQPAFDLSIKFNSFTAGHCNPGPGAYTLQYEIKNAGTKVWNDSVIISLYSNEPSQYGAPLIAVFKTGKLLINPGETYYGSFDSTILANHSIINGIVNFNGNQPGIAMPAYPYELLPYLVINGEKSSVNNYSNPISRSNSSDCIPTANVSVDVRAGSIGCNETVDYTVRICNNGSLDARLSDLTPAPDSLFSLLHAGATDLDSATTSYYSTYFGGFNADYVYSAAADKFGYIYIAGQTNSPDKIATPGAWRISNGGTQDAFLAKFTARGQRVWATYFGGAGPENGYSVTTDKDGNVYLAGETSISPNIATAGTHQPASAGNYDAYLAKFNANGTLLWSTYYGGNGADYGRSVVTDNEGNVYLAGNTASTNGIATAGAHQTTLGGGVDGFLVKFNAAGVRQWGTYYGGAGTESGFGVAADASNNVYLTGITASTTGIATPGSFQPVKDIGNDAYLVKFNKNGVRQWGTYYGGNGSDNSTSINIDQAGNSYIAGNTSGTNNIATVNACQPANGGGTDAFLVKFNPAGNRVWSTYYGGAGTENGRHVNTGKGGFIYLSGITSSNTAIATSNGIQPLYGGNTDAFLVKFDTSGVRQWGTYFGGPQDDIASASVTDMAGKVFMAGAAQSTQLATPFSYQEQYGGGSNDAFLLKIDEQADFILRAGKCITVHYYYDVTAATAKTYDFSYGITAKKYYDTDPDPALTPDNNGFNGKLHHTDDVTVNNTSPACTPGDKVRIQVDIPEIHGCGLSGFVTATITINNNSGSNMYNAMLHMQLTGPGSLFSGEFYALPSQLIIARPDISNPLYPNVANALLDKTGAIDVPLYLIPPGVSRFKIDMLAGTASLQLFARIDSLPTFVNNTGSSNTASNQNAVTATPLPIINNWQFPAAINAGEAVQLTGITTANAQTVQWVSGTAGNITNNGTLAAPALLYQPTPADIANGYVMLSLTVLTATGCDASKVAYIPINNVSYDYGDAPAGYDLDAATSPLAAGATLLTGVYLGNRAPSADAMAKSGNSANGDGREEDGLAVPCPHRPVKGQSYTVTITATNNSHDTAYINAFADWNTDGDYLDNGETSLQPIKVLPQTGLQQYTIAFIIPDNVNNSATQYFMRLRLSTDAIAVKKPYGPAAGGETEDHLLIIGESIQSQQQVQRCKGEQLTVGTHAYSESGIYTDTLIAATGCDSIVHTNLTIKTCGPQECSVYLPNAFTPGAGHNNLFRAKTSCPVGRFHLLIYNRMGQNVFETNDIRSGWNGTFNGTQQPSGAFVWYCRYEINGVLQTKKGTVILVR